jgi:hypothetical protein
VNRLDDDHRFPAYGFGDSSTRASCLFSLRPGDAPCEALDGVAAAYRAVKPHVRLAGGTSFAPAIYRACEICKDGDMQVHLLVILTDGIVDSQKRAETRDAIAFAKAFPLSILIVGIGAGDPATGWADMVVFDDEHRDGGRDNVDFVAWRGVHAEARREAEARGAPAGAADFDRFFGAVALKELPQQVREMRAMGLIGARPPAAPMPASWTEARATALRRGQDAVVVLDPPGGGAAQAAAPPPPAAGLPPPRAAAPPPPLPPPAIAAPRAAAPAAAPPPKPPAAAAAGGGAALECAVCFAEVGSKAWGRVQPCGHAFCMEHCENAVARGSCHRCRGKPTGAEPLFL